MDRVHKPHNLAAVVRTADAVGVAGVHIVPESDFNAAYRPSMGAARYVGVERHSSLAEGLSALRSRRMRVVAAHPDPDATPYRDVDYTHPTALLLGTELDGLSDDAVAAADLVVAVPMRGAVASLNVSVAAALVLYEAERQRDAAGAYDRPLPDTPEARATLFEWAYPRIADLCRRRGVPYPALSSEGEILGVVPR